LKCPAYISRSTKLLTAQQRQAIVDHLAALPTAGDLIAGGGGVRKLRWAAPGRGKSGGVRVIHFFADERSPIFLVDIFAKNEKENYSDAELTAIRRLAKLLVDSYKLRSVK
jgi:hypothetical protein